MVNGKTKGKTESQEAVQQARQNGLLSPDLRAFLEARGIAATNEITAPEPSSLEPFSMQELCQFPTTIEGAEKQSVRFVLGREPQIMPSTIEGQKSFFTAEVYHEEWGPILLTGTYESDQGVISPVGEWLKKILKPGQAFQFASFKTSRGYHVIRPIPVQ